jgi:hypothetical protein
MNIFEELNEIMANLNIPVEAGYFKDSPPEKYAVLTPMNDQFDMFADDKPQQDVKNVRISVFMKNNYLDLKHQLEDSLLQADFTVEQRYYVEYEPDTKFHHYVVDVSKNYYASEIDTNKIKENSKISQSDGSKDKISNLIFRRK